MSEPYIGEIQLFAFDFEPRGYELCQGQLMSIRAFSALYSLFGTTYGGDGQMTFALPDLRGRMAIHHGQGPGLSPRALGEQGGKDHFTLDILSMPAHTHEASLISVRMPVSVKDADIGEPGLDYPAVNNQSQVYAENPAHGVFMADAVLSGATDSSGGGYPFNIMNPYLVMNYSVALAGVFPPRP